MTANPEYPTAPEVYTNSATPGFIIDPEAPPVIASQLLLDEIWLVRRPATRLLALHRFIDNSEPIPEGSVWHRLTTIENCRYYEFDQPTETAIKRDPSFKRLIEPSRYKSTPESGQERALKIRLRRLEVFLERANVAKDLGKASLQKAE